LIRVSVKRYEAGAFDDDTQAAELIQAYEARIAALQAARGAVAEAGLGGGGGLGVGAWERHIM